MVGQNSRFYFPLQLFLVLSFYLLPIAWEEDCSSIEIPAGIITAVIGVPYFYIYCAVKEK
ncbi:hypothetical protein KEH51_00310 [[Brevibacterium] frigoritolerans]|uniref:Uncharacterized protein n=1 Tax=Peribacillus frigoritolerans TaxID=450367 RepID=A0A941FNZ6_9BACI|nr:hypothetical protein [Peribacillus frigoritolerans]